MSSTFCTNCGSAVTGAAFCINCGTSVAASQAQTPGYSAPATNASGKSLQTGPLSFGEAIKSFFNNYVTFEGRATRSAYWFAALFIFMVNVVVGILTSPLNDQNGNNPVISLVSLAFFLPQLSVGIRRLHDAGRSGHYLWWVLLPIVGWILVIVALASQSENADNKYGPRP